MKSRLAVILILLIPLLLFANVVQAYRRSQLQQEISTLSERQHELVELNKRAILAVSVLTSPDRIGPLAADELSLIRLDPHDLILLEVPSGGSD